MAKDHNIFEVTKTLFAAFGRHSAKATTFENFKRVYLWLKTITLHLVRAD